MITKQFQNGSYIDALASGEYACLFWNSRVELGSFLIKHSTLPLSSAGNPLFLRIKNNPQLTIASQGHNTGNLLLWDDGWNNTFIHAGGKNPVIFDFDGKLYLPTPDTFVDGWSHVNPDTNLPVEQIKCYTGIKGLAEFVYLGQGIYAGQGLRGGLLVSIVGESFLRVLDAEALPVFIRSDIQADKFSLAFVNQLGPSGIYWGSLNELKTLPIYQDEIEPSFGPTSNPSPNGTVINDIARFFFSPSNSARDKDHKIKQFKVSDNKHAYVKFGNKDVYEIWYKDAFGIHHLEDHSDKFDGSYRYTDTRWCPSQMKVGHEFSFKTGEHYAIFFDKNCKEINKVGFNREHWILAHYKEFSCGKSGVHEVIKFVYDPTNGHHSADRYIEVYYLALGVGWVGWELHNSVEVWKTGKPVFSSSPLIDQNLFCNPITDNTIPAISGCAVYPLPPVEPPGNQLKKPEVTVESWKPDATVDGWEFKAIDRENPGFGFKVWTENGSFYASITNPVGSGRTGATRAYKKCSPIVVPPVEPPTIPPGIISKIRVDGLVFRDEQNNIFPYRGFTSFLLYKRFLDGEDIVPYLKAWSGIGYNLTRVFGQVNWTGSPGPGFLVSNYPNYFNSLPSFFNLLSQHGLYCEFVAHTYAYDSQQQADYVNMVVATGKSHKNFFLELCNEPPVNNIDLDGLLSRLNTSSYNFPWATGQYYPTAEPNGTYVTTHTPRDDEWPRKSKYLLEYHQGGAPEDPSDPQFLMPIVADEPIGGADFNQPGRRSNVPSDFYAYAALAQLMGAGATYHHESGLNSIMPDGVEWDCAKAFINGLRMVSPSAQQGSYTRVGLHGCPIKEDNSLRTYGMISGNLATMVRVRPTSPYVIADGWRVTSEDAQKIVITLVRI